MNRTRLGQLIIESLREFFSPCKAGKPFKVTKVVRHETADGPMHKFTEGWVLPRPKRTETPAEKAFNDKMEWECNSEE